MKKFSSMLGALAAFLWISTAEAAEVPIGEPVVMNGMSIAGVYLQPIVMEPAHEEVDRGKADIHLEADITGAKGNKNGFAVGEWIPYLKVTYKLKNTDNGKTAEGMLHPMVASDGPHYGRNIKMFGPGNYSVVFTIEPPIVNNFGRHTDKETGVGAWFKPFSVEFKFKYFGAGKKGGY